MVRIENPRDYRLLGFERSRSRDLGTIKGGIDARRAQHVARELAGTGGGAAAALRVR